jgi:endonuclease YncB( thermonuclease family)
MDDTVRHESSEHTTMPAATDSLASVRGIAAIAALAAIVIVSPSQASGCAPAGDDEGHVATIIDARTFRLDDGREIRLAAIEAVPATSADGVAVLASLIEGRHVILRGETDAPDRYGRQSAFVFPGRSPFSVQHHLLARGAALFSGQRLDASCAAELRAAETEARHAKAGTWATSVVIKSAENPDDILARIGQFAVVEGRVLSVRQAGGTVYVNFGRRWTRDFAATISRRRMPLFEAAGMTAKSLENQRVRVRGWVERHGGPQIELLGTGQIEVIGGSEPGGGEQRP